MPANRSGDPLNNVVRLGAQSFGGSLRRDSPGKQPHLERNSKHGLSELDRRN
jgi:hypothetical protein